ncbi:MAG TPA: TIGR03435 family protein [Verrucomicrobiae bacterium]|nr:TIGR03435 family protein [Verrucomicrobiae bacterium]
MSRSPLIAAAILAAHVVIAQPAARPKFDEFEVASIKPAAVDATGRYIRMQTTHEFVAWNHALLTLVAAAYNLSPRAIAGGPRWVESEHFDIVAKAPNEIRPNLDEQMGMLRKLLADRFKLQFHREQREMSMYALTAAKGGPKLKPGTESADANPQGPPPLIFVVSQELVRLPGRNATMGELASVMQRSALDHPVVDRTGLNGRYDFDLEFAPDESLFGGTLGKGLEASGKPGLFAAMQEQLGLRLESTRGPVEVLVVDHAERPVSN